MRTRLIACSRTTSASRPRSSAERSRATAACAGASRSASDSMVTVWGAMPSAVPAVVRIAVRVPSSAARRPISAWMSARRAMTSSTSRARIDWPWRRTTLSSRRAEAIWASRWPMTWSPRPGAWTSVAVMSPPCRCRGRGRVRHPARRRSARASGSSEAYWLPVSPAVLSIAWASCCTSSCSKPLDVASGLLAAAGAAVAAVAAGVLTGSIIA